MPKIKKKQLETVLEHSYSASDNKSKQRYGFPYRKRSNFCCFQNSFQLFTTQPGKMCQQFSSLNVFRGGEMPYI